MGSRIEGSGFWSCPAMNSIMSLNYQDEFTASDIPVL